LNIKRQGGKTALPFLFIIDADRFCGLIRGLIRGLTRGPIRLLLHLFATISILSLELFLTSFNVGRLLGRLHTALFLLVAGDPGIYAADDIGLALFKVLAGSLELLIIVGGKSRYGNEN
jgi:hypothetical protein